jgi:TonB family protein
MTEAGPPSASSDAFGMKAGSGDGTVIGGTGNGDGTGGGGGDFGAAAYGAYLRSTLQQAVAADDKVSHLFFATQVDIWINAAGVITRVSLAKSSGDGRTDAALIAALKGIGRLDEAPPAQLKFPARIALRGRRA